jgi:hypothetical protein
MDKRFKTDDLYDKFAVTIKIRERLCGGMPKNPDMIHAWVKSRTGHDDEQTEQQTKEAIEALIEAETEACWTGFPADERGLFIWCRQLKAMFKESASMLRVTVTKKGSKQILQHGFEIKGADGDDQRIRLGVSQPSGSEEGPIHVMTAQGPRTALKRFDYVQGVQIKFQVWVLKTAPQEKRHVGEKELIQMLTFAQENGLGANRSQGYGKFDVVEFAKID